MRNNKGITLVSLVVTIMVIIIIASITIYASLDSYHQMKFESFKSQMEEIQRKVDTICTDYQLYLKDSSIQDKNYKNYFENRVGSSPTLLSEMSDTSKITNIIEKYFENESNYHEGYIFYFSKENEQDENEILKYFDLKGVDMDILVDFSTRAVYSIEGHPDPDDEEIIYYTPSDWGKEKNVVQTSDDASSSLPTSTLNISTNGIEKITVGSTTMYQVNLEVIRANAKTQYPLKKLYYSTDNDKWYEIENPQINGDTISFVIYDSGNYYFKVEDSDGAEQLTSEIAIGMGHDLPAEYQEVEYIESTGTQFIDTGYTPSNLNIKFKGKMYVSQKPTQESCFVGVSNSSKTMYEIGLNTMDGRAFAWSYSSAGLDSVPDLYGNIITFEAAFSENNPRKYFNIVIGSNTYTSNQNLNQNNNNFEDGHVTIFSTRTNSARFAPNGRIYGELEIIEGTEPTMMLIPCYRKSDNVIGMYDKVNNEFYTNSGTGTFEKGKDIY